jgi:hypothetical protein
MAVAIVGGAVLRVHQDLVSFADFLELVFAGFVVRVAVGMKFEGQFAVGLLDVLLAGATVHAEDFVIVAF